MTRLVVFGCSSSYGQGLLDCPTGNEPPSRLSWPSILASKLNLDCVNYSKCGAPNKQILLKLLNSELIENDLVVILWSFAHRGYILENSKDAKPILVQDKYSEEFYKIHTEYDMCVDTAIYMHYAKLYLNSKNIKNYQYYFDRTIQLNDTSSLVPITAEYLNYNTLTIDMAWDNIHLGPNSHKKIANYFYDKINVDSRL
jgi:hypothetical protein